MERHILVIEDNPDIARLAALHLSTLGLQVQTLADGRAGLQAALAQPPALLVLDLTLPGLDGLEICRELRRQRAHVPILMLTARSSELDRVLGLELGADDYLAKPFSVLELVARAKALLRRMASLQAAAPAAVVQPPEERLAIGGLQIDVARREVRAGERTIELTAKEFDLLLHFARSPGRVMTRLQLLQQVWGYGHSGYEHTVNTHINRLRAKIEADPNQPEIIQTVWGVGYRGCDARERGAPLRAAAA
ncbi:winged helix-turn-helix domain-containing protein [Aquabacterium sp.]|uniref:winged helix-turn-helix domain-containing protein n=1 Tax=Aquabacterium sp. TaxID=1872578 RepID=UPI003783C95F